MNIIKDQWKRLTVNAYSLTCHEAIKQRLVVMGSAFGMNRRKAGFIKFLSKCGAK